MRIIVTSALVLFAGAALAQAPADPEGFVEVPITQSDIGAELKPRNSDTLNPRSADLAKPSAAEENRFIPDGTGFVRAPVFRTLEEAGQAGINPRAGRVEMPLGEMPDELIEKPLWLQAVGWAGWGVVALGLPLLIWRARRKR